MDNIHTDKTKLIAGVKKATEAVKHTLGAAGTNVIIEHPNYPGHIITNDGISVLEAIQLEDPVEQVGLNLVKENSSRSNKESGDGSTTAAVLLEAILDEGEKLEISGMDIKKSLDECLPIIHEAIDKQTKQITVDEVAQVATISAEDPELGLMLQNIYKEIGKEGIIELDNSGTFETHYEITEGVRLRNCGFASPFMAGKDQNGNLKKKAELKNPLILIVKDKIANTSVLDNLYKSLSQEGKNELVIFCDEIDNTVIGQLLMAEQMMGFKTVIIKAPTLWKDWMFEDFAKITGATIIDSTAGTSFKKFDKSYLGTCDTLKVSKDETVVVGIKDISAHIDNLKEMGKENDQLILRASWLQTKACILKVGANSETELSYKRLKAEDAINASRLALMGGIVAGGGVCLRNVIDELETLPESVGGKILKKALSAPLRQIMLNANASDEDIARILVEDIDLGYNAKTGETVYMLAQGIVDPALIQKNAIKNAISIAGTVLSAKIVVTLNRQ